MGDEIALENGRISDFHGLVTLTLTSDWYYSIPSYITRQPLPTYQNFIEIEETFCGRTYGRTSETH